MNILDFIHASKNKQELEKVKHLNSELNEKLQFKLSVQQMDYLELEEKISNSKLKLEKLNNKIDTMNSNKESIIKTVDDLNKEKNHLLIQLDELTDDLNMQDYGIYKPRYNFSTSIGYKEELLNLRNKQKQMIKDKQAVSVNPNWTVNNSKAQGRKMNNNNTKSILRSFNNECEAAINKVSYSNIERIKNRISKSFEQLNKLYEVVDTQLKISYLELKLDELHLAYEYEQKKQEEKEDLREQRQREQEEKALKKEVEFKQKSINKEIEHYKNMIKDLKEKINSSTDDNEINSLSKSIQELESQIETHEKEKKELDNKLSTPTAGYVYIISNIGSFGNNIFKIGVTRRLEPLERISELSSASVPYKFDVHALIFSYDAYKLESELHHKFSKNRINKVNNRKEFFNIPIEEIETELSKYSDLTIDFNLEPDADEYKQTLAIVNNNKVINE